MTRGLHCAVVLAGVVAAGPATAGPDLSCSSDGVKATVEQLVTQRIMPEILSSGAANTRINGGPDWAGKIKLFADLDAIRTAPASTDRQHVCKAIITLHATYTGPRSAAAVGARASDAYKAAQAAGSGSPALIAFYKTAAGQAELRKVLGEGIAADWAGKTVGTIEGAHREMEYTVEATDDGHAYVTLLGNPD